MKARPANEFAGYLCEVHLRGLSLESTKVDFAKVSAGIHSRAASTRLLRTRLNDSPKRCLMVG